MIAQLLFLEKEDQKKDIILYVNSPGGQVTSTLAMYDTMQYVRSGHAVDARVAVVAHAPARRLHRRDRDAGRVDHVDAHLRLTTVRQPA